MPGAANGQHSAPPASVQRVPDPDFVADLFRGLAPRYNRVLLAYSFGQDLRWKHVLLERMHPERGERALDLACGTGLMLERLRRKLGAHGVVGADINRAMLREMSGRGDSRAIVQADAQQMPFGTATFDLLTSQYLLKYVQLEPFLAEAARVLRPGGRFGGYDFSCPRLTSPVGVLYSAYLHHALPWVGRGRTREAAGWRSVFDFLPEVAESSGWEHQIEAALEGAGFIDVELVPSLGGAISWVWATRPP